MPETLSVSNLDFHVQRPHSHYVNDEFGPYFLKFA